MMNKLTAQQAMEALRMMAREEAENRLGAAYSPGVAGERQAELRGAGFAFQDMAEQIERIQAEGFSDPDPVAEADTALRIAQNCLRLNAIYQTFWDGLSTQFGDAVVAQLVKMDTTTHTMMLHWSCIAAIVTEQTPEQHAHTEQMIANMKTLLDMTQAQIVDAFSGSAPIQ